MRAVCLVLLTAMSLPAQQAVSEATHVIERSLLEQARSFQQRLEALADRAIKATVGLRVGSAGGSGVIVSADGYVLTAAHVFEGPADVRVIFSDGRVVKGRTLGRESTNDFGLLKIEGDGPWPFCELGASAGLERGTLCVATGHPGGFMQGRTPPVRFGRVLSTQGRFVRTSCAIDRGDSGGPLFDVDGRVIGIHSRIGPSVTSNLHVPIDLYREHWERLTKGEDWTAPDFPDAPVIGVSGETSDERDGVLILQVYEGFPAAKAGLLKGDVILGLDGVEVTSMRGLTRAARRYKVGDEVQILARRQGKPLKVKLRLAAGR